MRHQEETLIYLQIIRKSEYVKPLSVSVEPLCEALNCTDSADLSQPQKHSTLKSYRSSMEIMFKPWSQENAQ